MMVNLFLVSLQTKFDLCSVGLWVFACVMGLTAMVIAEYFSAQTRPFSAANVLTTTALVLGFSLAVVADLQSLLSNNRLYVKFQNPAFLYSIDNYLEAAVQIFTAPVRLLIEP